MTGQPQTPSTGRLTRPVTFRIVALGLIAAALAISAAVVLATSAPPASPVAAVGPGPADADGFIGLAAATQLQSELAADRPAQMGRPGGPGGRGGFHAITISAKSGSSLSLDTEDGWARTITVASDTSITKGGVAITLADLNVGDTIAFRQTRNDDGTFTINEIRVFVPTVAGEVTAVESGSLTLKLRDGSSKVIALTGSTRYLVGQRDATRADVTVGDRVMAQGTVSGEMFTAISITIRPDVLAGTVTATTSDSITITTRDGASVTITVDASTSYRVPGTPDASLEDVSVDMPIVAEGIRTSDSTFTAGSIGAGGRMGPGGDRPFGRPFGPGFRGHAEMGPSGPSSRTDPATGTGTSAG